VVEEQANSTDLVMGLPIRWGLGYCIGSPIIGQIYGTRTDGRRVAFWSGSGGSWAFNDLDARMTVAYVMNAHLNGAFDNRSVALGQRLSRLTGHR
jgi:CubicO group peptidase (beta-lactamase class C family)